MSDAAAIIASGSGAGDFNGLHIENIRFAILSAARTLIPPRFQSRVTPEDMTQTALARVWKARTTFHGTTYGELFSFTVATLRNLIIDEVSRVTKENAAPGGVISLEDLVHSSGALIRSLCGKSRNTPSSRLIKEERRLAVLDAIERLTPSQRTAVIYRYYHDAPIAEIAAHLERSEGAVSMLLLHGVNKLERLLKGKI